MTNVPRYAETTPDVARGLTGPLWGQSLDAYTDDNPEFGRRFRDRCDDVVSIAEGAANDKWQVTEAAVTGGAASIASKAGGGLDFGSDGTSNHQGIEAHGPEAFRLSTHSTDANGRVVVEYRVDFDTADTVFVGLSEDSVLLSATSALPTDEDYIGFYTDDGGSTLSFVCANDNNGGTAVTDSWSVPSDIIQSGVQKLGFAVNTDNSVDIVVNGKYYPQHVTDIDSLALPIEYLAPHVAATAGGGTTAPNVEVYDVDVFEESN